jgi:outer membrane protein TolC
MREREWLQIAVCTTLLGSAGISRADDASEPPPVPKLQEAASDAGGSYEKITMTEAVHRALLRNPSAQVAAFEIDRATALLNESRSTSLPFLTANATYTGLDGNRTTDTGLKDANSRPILKTLVARNQLSANLTLAVPLVAPQRWVQWSQAKANVRATEAANQDVSRTVALATARAYLAVVSQKRVVEINARALATDRAHFDYTHIRLVGGVGNRVDDVRAAQQVASDEAQLETSYTSLARAREALAVLVGESKPLDVYDDVALASTSTDPEAAIAQRQDVAAANARLRLAEKVKKESWTDYTPSLAGQFIPFYQNPASFTTPETGWQALLVLSFPLVEGGLRRGQSQERAALVAEARSQYEGLLRQTRSDIRVAVEEIRRADNAMKFASNAASLAREAMDLANRAYHAGATSNIEVIDAERRARDADTASVIAEDNARQARLDLLAAAGQFP